MLRPLDIGAALPKSIGFHSLHEVFCPNVGEDLWLTYNPGVGKEDVQAPILRNRLINHTHHSLFVARVKLASVHVYPRVK